jgi:hypothetical protein
VTVVQIAHEVEDDFGELGFGHVVETDLLASRRPEVHVVVSHAIGVDVRTVAVLKRYVTVLTDKVVD